jgi:hypothetical protein
VEVLDPCPKVSPVYPTAVPRIAIAAIIASMKTSTLPAPGQRAKEVREVALAIPARVRLPMVSFEERESVLRLC